MRRDVSSWPISEGYEVDFSNSVRYEKYQCFLLVRALSITLFQFSEVINIDMSYW